MNTRSIVQSAGALAVVFGVLVAASLAADEPTSFELKALQSEIAELKEQLTVTRSRLKETQEQLEAEREENRKIKAVHRSMCDHLNEIVLGEKALAARGVDRKLKEAKIATLDQANGAAITAYVKERGGFGANQWARPVSLFPIANDLDGFAKSGDLIWDMRIEGSLGTDGVHQVIWINARTGATRSFLPVNDGKRTDQPRIENP